MAPSQLLKRHKTNKQTNTQEASLFSLLLPTKRTQVLVLEKRGKDGRGGEMGGENQVGEGMAGKENILLSQRNKINIDNGTWSYSMASGVH